MERRKREMVCQPSRLKGRSWAEKSLAAFPCSRVHSTTTTHPALPPCGVLGLVRRALSAPSQERYPLQPLIVSVLSAGFPHAIFLFEERILCVVGEGEFGATDNTKLLRADCILHVASHFCFFVDAAPASWNAHLALPGLTLPLLWTECLCSP